ncbi:DUF3558 family protein [Nocardia stercoris]|uniref:DUF3558 family protein n=1 Tax=Nocardia stercoris TaxID=2483361 RepID=UPI001319E3D1|nr:DUF3558 family protein [Nocardia stercoris]
MTAARSLRLPAYASLAVAAGLLAACGQGSSGTQDTPSAAASASSTPSSPFPTLTQKYLQPPAGFNQGKSPDRQDVVFDPCTWIPDSEIKAAGFDPASRERGEDSPGRYTFLLCYFKNGSGRLSILSGNVTMSEAENKYAGRTVPMTVNGRSALELSGEMGSNRCDVLFQTKAGYVQVGMNLNADTAVKGVKACDGLDKVAEAIEPSVGKDN